MDYQQALLEGLVSLKVVNEPGAVFVESLTKCSVREAVILTPTQYAKIEDSINGTVRIVRDPGLFFNGK